MQSETVIFVFGSNLAGRHGKGAALCARNEHGAEYGVGVGRTGNAYAIPTKGFRMEVLPISTISAHVTAFMTYALQFPELQFQVTKIGCGLAGYSEDQIAPMFSGVPDNCRLPDGWGRCECCGEVGISTSTEPHPEHGTVTVYHCHSETCGLSYYRG